MTYDPKQPRDAKGKSTGGQWTARQLDIMEAAARKAAGLPPSESGKSLLDKLRSGGFSVSLDGNSPTSGYMTATSDKTEFKKKIEDINDKDIVNYAVEHHKELQKENTYFGGWLDTDKKTGQVFSYLDVSTNYQSLEEAAQVAQNANQIGIYDVTWNAGKGRTIYVNDPTGRLYWIDEDAGNIKKWI